MTSARQPDGLPDNLPLLTEVIGENMPDEFPTLTEIVAESETDTRQDAGNSEAAMSHSDGISEEQMQKLLQQLEAHLETIFKQKLNLHIEQLQRQTIDQAIGELKAALPKLLRDALPANSRNDTRNDN